MLVYASGSLEVWQDLAYTYAVGREWWGVPCSVSHHHALRAARRRHDLRGSFEG
jgi:hypothetical protein